MAIIIADGIQIFILEWDGVHFIPGMIHGITADGIHHGIMADGMTHGITDMDMMAGTAVGVDGTIHGTTAAGTLHGIMVVGMIHGITVDITVIVAVTVKDSMTDTTVA